MAPVWGRGGGEMNDHIPDVTKMINQWTNGTEILNVKPNGDFELGNGVDPLVALGQLAKAFMQQQDRIKRLEDRIHRASMAFFRDGSDGQVASGMLAILEEERGKP